MMTFVRLTIRKTVAPRRRSRSAEAWPAPAGPFLKWVGGKTKLLDQLVTRAPRTYRRYFEPFLGGGALFFRLRPASASLSDLNAELIDCYRAIRDDVGAVIDALERHRARHSEAYYYATRDRWNEERQGLLPAQRAAAFIYLNKTCYNGLWRVNRRGLFNVPAGRYEGPTICDAAGLRAASVALRAAELEARPFETLLAEAEAGDFVYFDPPYVPVGATADFTSYTAEAFGLEDQRRLAQVFRALADRGCAVMLSNSDTPLVRRLYAGFRVDRVWAPRAVNSRADARGAVAEVIVTNSYY